MIRPHPCRRWTLLALAATVVCATPALAQQLVGGRNVNMAGGSQVIQIAPFQVRGDVLGRAQNEPSCAISTRNPQHVLCGANDYRMVDVPGVSTSQIIRDAWLGEFQSIDGGETWESTLLGGFFLDPAPHPLKNAGYTAGADAVVRAGPAGMTYYAGIAFTADKSKSSVHVTTYIDVNNRENDNRPFKRIRTTLVDSSTTAARFIDKPWIYVEAAAPGVTCTVMVPTPAAVPAGWTETTWERLISAWLMRLAPGWTPEPYVMQKVPASIIHVVYAVFLDPGDSTADIMYSRSDNCGQTFLRPVKLNPTTQATFGLNEHGNGAAIAKALATGSSRVYAAWRRARTTTVNGVVPDAIMSVVSNDNGRTWSTPKVVSEICPFDQGTSQTSFRSTAFPTMTADATGRAYIAWSDRRQPDGSCPRTPSGSPLGAARIRIATSTNGTTWTESTAAPSPTPEHQIQPTIAFSAGRLFLGWIDFREDASGVFGQFVNEAEVLENVPAIRHTGDVRASVAMPGPMPNFAGGTTQISEYLKGAVTIGGTTVLGQIQWNAVNRRWARKGTVPFNGDYIDVATLPYLPPLPGQTAWRPNNQATITTALGAVPNMPQVLFTWADNRDMRTGPGVDNPAVPVPYQTPNGLPLPANSVYAPGEVRPVCTAGADSYMTSTTNQNTYSARASIGFLAAAPGNNKDLGDVTRAFVVYVRNDTTASKSFRLIASPPPGGFASFHQFVTTQTAIDIAVPRRSSVARTIYVSRNAASATPLDPESSVRVDVIEMVGATPVQAATILLNADRSAPEIEAPEIEAREIYVPEIEAPEIEAHGSSAPEIEAPEIEAPEIEAPEIEAIAWKSLGLQRPEIEAPEIEAVEVTAPEIEAPEIEATAITDIRFGITNTGNTTAQYNAKAFVTPEADSDFRYQVIVRRRYELPAVDINCVPTTIAISKVAVNLPDVGLGAPEIEAPEIEAPEIEAPEIEAAGIATFYLEPGAKAEIIIRARSASGRTLEIDDADIAVEPPVDSDDADLGITKAETVTTYLSISTAVLPAGYVGAPYARTLETSGAIGSVTWELVSGSLPGGIVLTSSGELIGTPNMAGTYTFRVRATDSTPSAVERDLTLVIATMGVANLAFVTQPTNTPINAPITPAISVKAFLASGLPAAGVAVTLSRPDGGPLAGTLTRTTGPTGIAVFENLSVSGVGSVVLRATAPGYTLAHSIPFNVGAPDLAITDFQLNPDEPTISDSIAVRVSVTNIGSGLAAPSTLMMHLPGDTAGAPATLLPVPALAAGVTYQAVRTIAPLPEGGHGVIATADYFNVVDETNEANNTDGVDFDVTEDGGEGSSATIYASPAPFALATDATNATGPLPNLGSVAESAQIGRLEFSIGPDGDTLDIGGGSSLDDWYPNLPGHDIALGNESLQVEFDVNVTSFGFYFVEPSSTMPAWGGTPADSPYSITLYGGESEVVGTYYFNAPDDQVVFIGVNNAVPFRRAVIKDESGNDDDEYFGEFYAGDEDNLGTFVVTTTADSGGGSLRAAMLAAEAQPGKNQIVFDLTTENRTILLDSPLPTVSSGNPLILDATTQAGFDGPPEIRLTVNEGGEADDGLRIDAGNSIVRGFAIDGFAENGIAVRSQSNLIIGNWIGLTLAGEPGAGNDVAGIRLGFEGEVSFNVVGTNSPIGRNVVAGSPVGIEIGLSASANTIAYNYIGTDPTGMFERGNGTGVRSVSNTGGNEIVGNVIAANSFAGVFIGASNGNFVRGNTIGLGADGGTPLSNDIGVLLGGDEYGSVGNVIGGLLAGQGNVIAGNPTANIQIESTNSGTLVQGNVIGATAGGLIPSWGDTQQYGINIIGATGTIVGGSSAAARNRIVGTQFGVQFLASTVSSVEGNFIGTFDGVTPLGEMDGGVFIEGSAGITVGGVTSAHGNVIGNTDAAVTVISADGEGSTFTTVEGNKIGVGADGATDLPVGSAVVLQATGGGVILTSAIGDNVIENTTSSPIVIIGDGVTGAQVRRNNFSNNAGIPFDIGADGADANDAGDSDTGPNNRQNHPVLTAVTPTLAAGTINSIPDTEFIVDLYICTAGTPSSYASTINVTTNAEGNAFFSLGFGGLTSPVAAMATSAYGDSSEISSCVSPDTGALLVTNTNDGGSGSLRSAILAANAAPDANVIYFQIPGWPHTITPSSPLPTIHFPVTIDATSQAGYDGKPAITLDGSLIGAEGGDGLILSGNTNTIRGLAIGGFRYGIRMITSDFNTIQANHLGVDRTGLVDAGNLLAGVLIDGNDNVIGGTTAAARNVISGNDDAGVLFLPTGTTTENLVQGNYIGVGLDGTTAIGNGEVTEGGIDGSGVDVGYGAVDNTIGGAAPGAGNVISGNGTGVYIHGSVGSPVAFQAQVRGNYIGTNAAGTGAVANTTGVIVENSVISVHDNVIAGNLERGMYLETTALTHVSGGSITGNRIGILPDDSGLGNGLTGIFFETSPGNSITSVLVQSNTVAYNFDAGIALGNSEYTTRIQMLSNAIFSNDGPGIDLGLDGGDVNDDDDTDVGPNFRQNRPLITVASPETSVIEGIVDSAPNTLYRLQIFTSPICELYPGGRDVVSDQIIETDGNGVWEFSQGGVALTPGMGVTATVTDMDGNTSEFSNCFTAGPPISAVIDFEDFANSFGDQMFLTNYRGITWSNFRHQAPYGMEVEPNGHNAIRGATDGARMQFSETVFLGAKFYVPILNPELTNPPNDQLYFELYHEGALVWTSSAITTDTGGAMVFLASGYSGLVDEVRVRTTGVAMMSPFGSAWIMDDVEFDAGL